MSITTRNKQDITNNIIEAELGIILEKDVMETIKDFAHRKNVDKRFTDAVSAKGYHSYILKDKFSTKLVVKKRIENPEYVSTQAGYVEFTVYMGQIMESRPLTWQQIADEFKRYNYTERLANYKQMFDSADSEVEEFKKFVEFVDSQNFKCFDLWKIKSDLKEALKHATKK